MIQDHDPDAQRPTQVRWLIFILACTASGLLYVHRYAWGVIKPTVKEQLGLTDGELGWLDSAFLATYGVGQVPGGLAGDLFGPRAVLTISTLLWSLTVALLAWAPGFWGIFSVRAVFGAAQAAAYPVLNKVTKSWFPLSIRTSVQGAVVAMSRLGAACSSVLVASLLMHTLGFDWRDALLIIAGPGIALAAGCWVVFRDSPANHPWCNDAERQLIADGELPAPAGARVRLDLTGGNLLQAGFLLMASFASTFADQLYVFWIPSFLKEGRGLGDFEMGLFATLPLIGGAIGGQLGGVLNDLMLRWTGRRRFSRSVVAFAGKSTAAVLIALSVLVADGRLAMVVLLAVKFFGDWSLPSLWGAITDMGGRGAATLFGVVNTAGSVGGFLAGPVLGIMKQDHGWEGLFFAVAGVYMLTATTWLFLDCTRRLVVEEVTPATNAAAPPDESPSAQ